MDLLTEEQAARLFEAAASASAKAYAPFSNFGVGAAALSRSGKVFTGSNVENASYGLSICAERVAVSSMVAAGERELKAIAVHCINAESAPCGACRQFIIEFGPDALVVFMHGNKLVQFPIAGLLPYAFTKAALGQCS